MAFFDPRNEWKGRRMNILSHTLQRLFQLERYLSERRGGKERIFNFLVIQILSHRSATQKKKKKHSHCDSPIDLDPGFFLSPWVR